MGLGGNAQYFPITINKNAMISVTSVTDNYILQPAIFQKHQTTVEWLSACLLWKRELKFFQKLLDKFSVHFRTVDDKKKVDHFQSIITYYGGELIDTYKSKLRTHEKHLAQMLGNKDETDTRYIKEHDALMGRVCLLDGSFDGIEHAFEHFGAYGFAYRPL